MMGYGTAGLLISAAVGYWVLERASTQKKDLKMIGQVVGALIIVTSFMGVACKTYYLMRGGMVCSPGAKCPMVGRPSMPQQPMGK